MCSLGNHDLLSYSFHSVSHGGFWLSRPRTAVWTWLDAGCWQQSHLPSPGAFTVLATPWRISFPLPCPLSISPSTFLHSPSHALQGWRLLIHCCCLSLLSPLPQLREMSHSWPCPTALVPVRSLLPHSSFLPHWFSVPVLFKSIINFSVSPKSETDVAVTEP